MAPIEFVIRLGVSLIVIVAAVYFLVIEGTEVRRRTEIWG